MILNFLATVNPKIRQMKKVAQMRATTSAQTANYKPLYIFSGVPGFPVSFENELEALCYFFTNELADFIINETNHQATTLKSQAPSGKSRASVWENLIRDEFFFHFWI